MVITGAGGGIMEAGHLGAGRELSMGLNILLPFEQSANPIIDGDPKLVTLKYFFTRKLMFVKECSAVICLPGGFGTLDETLEVLTLLQTGKQTMIPMVLLDEPAGTTGSTSVSSSSRTCWSQRSSAPKTCRSITSPTKSKTPSSTR